MYMGEANLNPYSACPIFPRPSSHFAHVNSRQLVLTVSNAAVITESMSCEMKWSTVVKSMTQEEVVSQV